MVTTSASDLDDVIDFQDRLPVVHQINWLATADRVFAQPSTSQEDSFPGRCDTDRPAIGLIVATTVRSCLTLLDQLDEFPVLAHGLSISRGVGSRSDYWDSPVVDVHQ
jgi:hypothetical protein